MDKQMLCIKDRAKLHELIDAMGDDGLAFLVTRNGSHDSNAALNISSYGEGRETEFLGLLGYAQVIIYRTYFVDDDE